MVKIYKLMNRGYVMMSKKRAKPILKFEEKVK